MANKNNDKEIYCSFCGKPQITSRLRRSCPMRILPSF